MKELYSPRQTKVITRLINKRGGAVFWRVGTGKTRIALGWFAVVAKLVVGEVVPRFLVVCRREAFYDWTEEVKKLGLNFKVWEVESEEDIFRTSFKTRGASSPSVPTLYLLSHGKLATIAKHFTDHASLLYAVAYDEGFLYKNPDTKHCKAAHKLSTSIGSATILSGSVMTARDLTDIFGQLYAINKNDCLARTLTEFRTKYMYKFRITDRTSRWTNSKHAGSRVASAIKPVSSFYFPDNSARRIVTDVRTIPATSDQLRHFKSLKEFYELELRGRVIELKNAPSVIIKCQQISDGFVLMDNQSHLVASGKLDYLLARITELLSCGEKVVVWCAFRRSVDLILQALQKKGIRAFGMSGDHPFNVAGWKSCGQVAVCTVASGSSVNHFRHCAYAIYYSHSFHWLHMQQSKGRNNRKDSQHKTCFYYFLQTQGSMDRFVYRTVNGSEQAEAKIIQTAVQSWLQNSN